MVFNISCSYQLFLVFFIKVKIKSIWINILSIVLLFLNSFGIYIDIHYLCIKSQNNQNTSSRNYINPGRKIRKIYFSIFIHFPLYLNITFPREKISLSVLSFASNSKYSSENIFIFVVGISSAYPSSIQ